MRLFPSRARVIPDTGAEWVDRILDAKVALVLCSCLAWIGCPATQTPGERSSRASPNVVVTADTPRVVTPSLGVHAHLVRSLRWDDEYASRDTALSWARAIGTDFVRLGFVWKEIQPRPGVWEWARHDSVVSAILEQELRVLGLLHGPPDWGYPAHRHTAEWETFVDSVVARYGDRVAHWEIWNEPNLDHFWPRSAPVKAFHDLVRQSARVIRARQPNATIILGGMANQPSGFRMWQELFSLGTAREVDAIAFHAYRIVGTEMRRVHAQIDSLLGADASSKPIWITEYGWQAHEPALSPRRSDAFARLVRYGSQVALGSGSPASVRIVIDRHEAGAWVAAEALGDQLESYGWNVEIVAREGTDATGPSLSANAGSIVIWLSDERPAQASERLGDLISEGAIVVTTGRPYFAESPRPRRQRGVDRTLAVAWTKGESGAATVRAAAPDLEGLELPALTVDHYVRGPTQPTGARYRPLLTAQRGGQNAGDVAALIQFPDAPAGALLATSAPVIYRPRAPKEATFHGGAAATLATYLVHVVEGGGPFILYELRDDRTDKNFGILELDFRPKDVARALQWVSGLLGDRVTVRSRDYRSDGALLELETRDGMHYIVTWGASAYRAARDRHLASGGYVPLTYRGLAPDSVRAGLEAGRPDLLQEPVFWREMR